PRLSTPPPQPQDRLPTEQPPTLLLTPLPPPPGAARLTRFSPTPAPFSRPHDPHRSPRSHYTRQASRLERLLGRRSDRHVLRGAHRNPCTADRPRQHPPHRRP